MNEKKLSISFFYGLFGNQIGRKENEKRIKIGNCIENLIKSTKLIQFLIFNTKTVQDSVLNFVFQFFRTDNSCVFMKFNLFIYVFDFN